MPSQDVRQREASNVVADRDGHLEGDPKFMYERFEAGVAQATPLHGCCDEKKPTASTSPAGHCHRTNGRGPVHGES